MTRAPALIAGLLIATADLSAQTPTPTRPANGVVHEIRVSSDLLLMEQAAEFVRALEKPAELVIIDLRCDAWREGVIESMARGIARSETNVAVLLRSGDSGAIPAGALALGLCADRMWVVASASVRPGLHPTRFDEEPEAERAAESLIDIVQDATRETIGDRGVIESLLRPRLTPARVVRAEGLLVLAADDHAGQCWTLMEQGTNGAHALAFSAQILIDMGLASPLGRTTSAIPSHFEVRPRSRERTAIDVSLEHVRAWSLRAVEDAKADLAAVDKLLDDAESRYRTSPSVVRLREAGGSAGTRLSGIAKQLDGIDEHLRSYPEVLSTPAPGLSELTGGDRDDRVRGWTKALSTLRKQADGLRTRATEIADR